MGVFAFAWHRFNLNKWNKESKVIAATKENW